MFSDIKSNKNAIEFLKKELQLNRESGTYLFCGEDRELLKKIAKSFAKSLNCNKLENDFCDECESCIRIEKETHADLEILEDEAGVKIDRIREIVQIESISSYEGKNKIYIIRDIEKMRREACNALLKMIEEPAKGSYFLLLSRSLNILNTIKSRSIIINIKKETAEELEVSEKVYSFFQGNSVEIEEFKKSEIELENKGNYLDISEVIKNWKKDKNIENTIELYATLKDFINVKEYLTDLDRLFFAEEIYNSEISRAELEKIVVYLIGVKNIQNSDLERLLELKIMLKSNINIRSYIYEFIRTL